MSFDRYRWIVLAACVLAQAAVTAFTLGLPVLAPLLRTHFHLGVTKFGLVLATPGFGVMFAVVFWGRMADRFGDRAVLGGGLLGAACALGLAALQPRLPLFLTCVALAGAFGSSSFAATGRTVAHWFERSERGLAIGIRQTSASVGGMFAGAALPWVAGRWGLGGALTTLCALVLLAGLSALVWVRERPVPENAPMVGTSRFRELFRHRGVLCLAGSAALMAVPQAALSGFFVLFLVGSRHWSTSAAALAFFATQFSSGVFRLALGRYSDRHRTRSGTMRLGIVAGVAALLVLLPFTSGPGAVLVPLLILATALAAAWNGLSITAATELVDASERGSAIGFVITVMWIFATAAPAMFGVLLSAISWRGSFALLAVFEIGAFLVLGPLIVRERSGQFAERARRSWRFP